MAYPDFGILLGGMVELETDRQIDRASNGAARGRVFYTDAKRRFKVVHLLDAADLATFEAYYAANLVAEIAFTWGGVAYDVLFAREPAYKPVGGGMTEVTVELVEI